MKKIFVKTFGCTLNQRTSEELTTNAFIVENIDDADLIFINTCGVKEQTEFKIIKYLHELKKQGINENKIILFGCLIDIDSSGLKKASPKANIFGLKDQDKLKKLISSKNIIKKKQKITQAIIIANGCLGACTYCAVKFARGKLESKPITEIKKEIESALNKGTKEILLTAQDTGCYGLDININIVNLLKEIIKIPGDFRIRLGMANPQHLIKFYKELADVYKNEKIYKFLHIPIQAGDDNTLKRMNRFYSTKEIEIIIDYFRKIHPTITIATDVIVGFPEETETEFENTINFIKKIKPPLINISRFGKRKGIEANNLKDLHGQVKKERSRILAIVAKDIARKNSTLFVGKVKIVLVNEINTKKNEFMGKTEEYLPVIIKSNKAKNIKLGDILKLKIKAAKEYYLLT
ncbi:MAG: tRNA (N(6)-L-threonylcarbamoyladenosine(37)-C(2))-methylthiotransferase [archaeon]